MIDLETLSRRLEGDLSPAAEAAIAAKIAADPELREAWEMMKALPGELASLPETAPPARLNRAILGEKAPISRWWLSIPLAAAVLLGVWGLRPSAPEIVLAEGSQRIVGEVSLFAGDRRLDIDGDVLVQVEPPQGYPRGSGAEVDMKSATHLVSALAGAAITITVYQGTATVASSDGEVVISAGETESFGLSESKARPELAPADPPTQAAIRRADPAVQARITELEQQVAALQFEQALTRGQLRTVAGEPSVWPENLPENLKPAGFETALREAFSADRFAIDEVDCEEFPCVVTLLSKEAGDLAGEELQQAIEDFARATAGERSHAVVMSRDDNGQVVGGFAIIPDDHWSEDIGVRARYRTEGQLQGVLDSEE